VPEFDAFWNFDDPAGTEMAFRKILDSEASDWVEHDRAELLSQIARTLGLQGKFEAADAVLEEGQKAAVGHPRAEARVLLERGRVRNSSGDKAGAIPLFEQALIKADEAEEDFLAIDAIHMLAIASPPEKQMHWHREGIKRSEQSQDPRVRGWLGSLYNNLGWSLHDAEMYGEALSTFEKALAFRIEQGKEGPIRIAKWCVARCLRSLSRPSEALEMQRQLHQECASANAPDGYVEEEIGECLLELGRAEEAKPYFGAAFLLLEKPLSIQHEATRIARLRKYSC